MPTPRQRSADPADGPARPAPGGAGRAGACDAPGADAPNRPLSLATLAAYAAPGLPLGMLYFPVYVYVPPYYASLGVDLATLGLILLAIRLLDAVTDPAMGALSDRLPTRWGRRRSWLALACLPILASAWALFDPPADPSAGYVALWLAALTLAWTMALTPLYAWGAELHPGYAERVRAASWRESAGLIGAVLAAALYAAYAPDAGAGLFAVFLALALLLPPATAFALLKAPEPRDWSRRRLPLREGLAAAAANPHLRRLLPAHLVNGLANGLPAALFLFYAEHVIAAPELAGPFLVLYFLAAVAGAPLWSRLSRRFQKHRVWQGAMLWSCAVFAFALTLGEGDGAAFAAISALSGLALGADLALPAAIQADVADADAAETGEQRTAVYFSLFSIISKAALALSGAAALTLLDAAGFRAVEGARNAPEALQALILLYAGAPVALKLLAIALMRGFALDEAEQARIRARIEGRAG